MPFIEMTDNVAERAVALGRTDAAAERLSRRLGLMTK
jgi:hypothetical protein